MPKLGGSGRRKSEEAAKESFDVGIYYGDGLIVGEAAYRRCGVVSDAGELLELFEAFGQSIGAEQGRFVQVSGSLIISKSTPKSQHLIEGRFGQSAKSWKFGQKGWVVVAAHPLHLSLLEHDLADIDTVGITALAPR